MQRTSRKLIEKAQNYTRVSSGCDFLICCTKFSEKRLYGSFSLTGLVSCWGVFVFVTKSQCDQERKHTSLHPRVPSKPPAILSQKPWRAQGPSLSSAHAGDVYINWSVNHLRICCLHCKQAEKLSLVFQTGWEAFGCLANKLRSCRLSSKQAEKLLVVTQTSWEAVDCLPNRLRSSWL